MALDIKQLRIGAHVNAKGVDGMVRIAELKEYTVELCGHGWNVFTYDQLSPIPITPELLVELGFDCICMDEDEEEEEAIKDRICLRQFRGMDCWSLHIDIDDPIGFHVRYLHEVENFIYLTLGKELIEE